MRELRKMIHPTFAAGAFLSRHRFLRGFLLLLTIFLVSGCSDNIGGKSKEGGRSKKVVPVTIGLSEKKTVPVELHAVGTIEPFATVGIRSQITGTLQSVHFKEGADVKKGDLLFTIDPRPFVAQLNQAQGALVRDRAELYNAQKELERYSHAAQKGYVSTEQADQAQTKVATLSATVKADEAAVENARLQLEFCSIVSPISGQAGELLTDQGNLIKANADTAMVTINQISPIKVSFNIPGKDLQDIKKYQAAGSLKVLVLVKNGEPLTGTFSFLDNTVDPTTGTIRLKAEFANKDKILWPGEFVDVSLILTARQDAIVVPTAAIQIGQGGAHIYVVKPDMTVEDRHVATGTVANGETVIETGLQAGEKVVTDGQLQLIDGTKIEEQRGQSAPGSGPADTGKEKSRGTR
jgi:membrane fusion protein, multidrug efflux system